MNELERIATQNNRDLYVAYERIQEARALMGIAAADFYPQITINPLYTNMGELIKNYSTIPAATVNALSLKTLFRAHELLYFLPINLSYEVDLWGKIRDQYNAANYNWMAQIKDYESVMLTLTSNLAIAYFQLRTADEQINLLSQVIATRQKAFEINRDRFDEQITFYADVALAAEEIDIALMDYEEVTRQRKVLENQIAVLLGMPASEFCVEYLPLKGLPPCIPEGIPSDILMRRPDLVEVELKTRSAHALVKEAYTGYFPSLTLTASGGYESPVLKEFLHWLSRYWM